MYFSETFLESNLLTLFGVAAFSVAHHFFFSPFQAIMSVALNNPLASLEQLETTVSRRDGISEELEEDLRNLGAELIQSAGILLKL